jgi:hypothetical protein
VRPNLWTLVAGMMTMPIMVCTAPAGEASPARIDQLSTSIQEDAGKAKLFLQSLLQSRSNSKTILDCSVFVPKTVDGIGYLVAKVLITQNNVQSTDRAVVYFDPRAGVALVTERAYQYFLQTGDKELLETLSLDPNS